MVFRQDEDWDDFDGSTMPFGKHKGESIAWIVEQDIAYARWLIRQPWLYDNIQEALEDEIEDQYPDVMWVKE